MFRTLRLLVTWRRLAASALVLSLGYTVSRYAAAAPTEPPTPTPAVIVVESTPVLLVVTATPDPVATGSAPTPSLTPTHSPPTTSASPSPPTVTHSPTPAATATPLPAPGARLRVVLRQPLAAPAAAPRLAWGDAGTLWVADGSGVLRLVAPDFATAPRQPWQSAAGLGALTVAPGGAAVAGTLLTDTLWLADPMTGETITRAGRPLGWASDGRLLAHQPCGDGCTRVAALAPSPAQAEKGALVIAADAPMGQSLHPAPVGALLAQDAVTATIIADLASGDWWYLGGWRDPKELRAVEQVAGWVDGETLLTYHRSATGPTVAGHGRDLWRWDVRANSGRFVAADVAAAAPSPTGGGLALLLLGAPTVEGDELLVGGFWRPEAATSATLAIVEWPSGRLRWTHRLAEHPPVAQSEALDGWPALRPPRWSPDGRWLVAFDGGGRPLLVPAAGGGELTPLLATGSPAEIAIAPDGRHIALIVGDEYWVVALGDGA